MAKYLCSTNPLTSLANALKGRGALVLEADAKGQEQQPAIAERCALDQVMLLCTSTPSSENEANNTRLAQPDYHRRQCAHSPSCTIYRHPTFLKVLTTTTCALATHRRKNSPFIIIFHVPSFRDLLSTSGSLGFVNISLKDTMPRMNTLVPKYFGMNLVQEGRYFPSS